MTQTDVTFYSISWSDLHDAVYTLYEKINSSGLHFDILVAISRGGLTISHILSDFLKLPVTSIIVRSYEGIGRQAEMQIDCIPGEGLANKHILLVDDLTDSGKTFEAVMEAIQPYAPSSLHSAALYTKPHTTYMPTFSILQVKDWVVFPYEVRETIESIRLQIQDPGSVIQTLGFPKKMVRSFSGADAE